MNQGITKRLMTIPKAARQTGIAESLIRSWILQGDLQTYPNLDSGNPEPMIDVLALLDLIERNESEGS